MTLGIKCRRVALAPMQEYGRVLLPCLWQYQTEPTSLMASTIQDQQKLRPKRRCLLRFKKSLLHFFYANGPKNNKAQFSNFAWLQRMFSSPPARVKNMAPIHSEVIEVEAVCCHLDLEKLRSLTIRSGSQFWKTTSLANISMHASSRSYIMQNRLS